MASKVAQCSPGESETFESSSRMQLAEQVLGNWMIKFIEILEPHDPSLSDNFEKAVGLAKFAERHGAKLGRIQLIRKQSSAGGDHYALLEINKTATIKKLLLITSNPQLDELFVTLAS